MYGCTSNATCFNDTYCECNEIYNLAEANVTTTEYGDLSLDELWYYQFRYTNASVNLLAAIRNGTALSYNVLVNLRNPHKTPQDTIDLLYVLLPTYNDTIAKLQPIRRGLLDDFLTANKTFENEKFRRYLESKIDNLTDDVYGRLVKIEHKDTFVEIIRFINNEEDIKYLLRQLFLFPSDFVKEFAQDNGYNIADVLEFVKSQTTSSMQTTSSVYPRRLSVGNGSDIVAVPAYTTEEIDEILLSGILEIFIQLISGYTD